MWIYLYPAVALVFLIALSYTDIKNRKAPPILTNGLLAIGITLHAAQTIISGDPNPLLYSASIALAMFTVSYIIYRLGGWAGGDVKLFTALGAILPFHGAISQLTYPVPYPILILAASTISALPFILGYGIYKTIKERKTKLKKDIMKSLPKSIYSGFIILATLHLTKIIGIHPISTVIIAPMIYLSKQPGYPLTAFLATLTILQTPSQSLQNLLYFLTISILAITGIKTYKSIKKNVLREEKSIKELEEGEIPGEDVWKKEEIKKKEPSLTRFTEPGELIIDSRKARGLTKQEINTLKEKEIETLKVKKSLPFIPVLTGGLVILLILEIFI